VALRLIVIGCLGKTALGKLGHFRAGKGSQRNQLVEFVVFVVEEPHLGVLLGVLGWGQTSVAIQPIGLHCPHGYPVATR